MSTPMMQQYQQIKAQIPEAILFFRLGDFYEMFAADAELAAPILEIALTGRDAGGSQRVPMCGVPYHAVEHYMAKLVSAGYKVAICEQVEDPKQAKGIVKREIIRIVSPGTLTENLPEEQDNYLASVFYDAQWGLAFLDVASGEFAMFQTRALEQLQAELARIHPAELLLPRDLRARSQAWQGYYLTERARADFLGVEALAERFPAQAALFLEYPAAGQAANALWRYFEENMPGVNPSHILEIKVHRQGEWMDLDPWTRRNLELTEGMRGKTRKGTLLAVLDRTKTAGGTRLLRHWVEQPLLSRTKINRRLDAVTALVEDGFLRGDLQGRLAKVYDAKRLMGKIAYGNANARDMLALAQTLKSVPQLQEVLQESGAVPLQSYLKYSPAIPVLAENLENALNPEAPLGIKDGNLIQRGYSSEVDSLREVASGGRGWVAALESSERERTGIRSLKVGYNRVFGYYIEITHANAHLVPSDYLRKQTLANAERFVTPELKAYEEKILTAENRLKELEYQIFLELREEARQATTEILRLAQELAEIDVLAGLAETAVRHDYVRPELNERGELQISEGRHPVVEEMLESATFVPNDTVLTRKKHLGIITGPNMAGKSTYMRQVALITLMAHVGSFVPAKKADISLVDRIFTRVGASDDLASGQSTFMVEMQEVAQILKKATPNSLVILDEVGRGTATFDGLSIAWAVAEYLLKNPALQPKTLFATHYHELTQLEAFPGAFNLHVSVREHGEEIIFLHKILPGKADRSYGIQVARLAGVPGDLLQRAKGLLQELESSSGHTQELLQSKPATQLALFDEPELHPLLSEIADLDVEDMSPRQALDYLFELRERLRVSEVM